MTINSEVRVAGPFQGNDVAVDFPFTFKVFDADEVLAVREEAGVELVLELSVDYTVALNADQEAAPGGAVTLLAGPLPSGETLTLTSALAPLQPVDLTNQGGFYPRVINASLDRLTILVQQLSERLGRTLVVPISDGESGGTLPSANDRKGTVLAFNEVTGAPQVGPTIAAVNTVAVNTGAINTVADNVADVNTVADNVADVTNFADVYYGPSAIDPTLRRDGSPLQAGDMYFNTSIDSLRSFNGVAWRGVPNGAITVQNFSGDGVETEFLLNYAPDNEEVTSVFISGVYQQKNTYELGGAGGAWLIFDAPPPAGTDNIEVVVAALQPSDDKLRLDLANDVDQAKGAALVAAYGGTVLSNLREKLYADRIYYVRTDGNDTNTGLANTAVSAFRTLQRAANVISDSIDLNGFNVTVNVANGTYTAGAKVFTPWVGEGNVSFVGNVATPASCVINASDNQGVFYADKSSSLDVRGFKVTNSAGDGISAATGAFISVGAMEYGPCTASHLVVGTGGVIYLTANYTVTGGGSSHLHAGSFGHIFTSVITVTVTGTPTFSAYFAGAAQGNIIVKDVTFTGAATCARYLAHKGGVIETHPAYSPALPGSIAGRVAYGGSYIGSTAEPFEISVNTLSSSALTINAFNEAGQTFRTILACVTDPGGTGRGYLYANGSGSYLSNMTHLGTDTQVQVSLGTADGISVYQGGEINASRPSAPCAFWRRRTTDGQLHVFYRDTTQSGNISVSAGATTYNTTSDYRLKTKPNPLVGAVERFKQLNPCVFEMLSAPGVLHEGFIAHEVAEVVPLAVTGEKDAMVLVGDIVDDETGETIAVGVERPIDLPDGHNWEATGEVVNPQSLDAAKLIPLMAATIKELLLRLEALESAVYPYR